mmetsp:Transcript_14053/g.23301  ORF Transcript_14053/g.23301 Transcript_14053/m.23301 type:complete len:395 (-) Transcript_14053:110-1294(-)
MFNPCGPCWNVLVGVLASFFASQSVANLPVPCKYSDGDKTSYGNYLHNWRVESPFRQGLAELPDNNGRDPFLTRADGPAYKFNASAHTFLRVDLYQQINISSRDGVRLNAWYAAAYGTRVPAVIITHGALSCSSGKWPPLLTANMLWRAGFNVLLVDLRNHGLSQIVPLQGEIESFVNYGLTEYLDLLGAWDWLISQGWQPHAIALFAPSMGGSAAMIAMAEEPRVRAAWFDAMMCTPSKSLFRVATNEILPHFLNDTLFLDRLFEDVWSEVNARVRAVDLSKRTALQLASQLHASQSVAFVVTTGDLSTGWKETRDCYEAALTSAANVSYFKQFDDRNDFSTGVPNGVEYKESTTNNFDTHVASMLYYTATYFSQLVKFLIDTVGPPATENIP